MAEGKKSFLIYCDIIKAIEHLTDDEKGRLFQHLLEYVNDMNPVLEDRILIGCWKPIELQLKRDLKKYEGIKERNAKNGSLGGRPKKQEEPKKPTGLIENPTKPKKADTDTVTDTVNDIDTVNVNKKETKKSEKDFSDEVFVCFVNCLEFFPEHLKPKKENQKINWLEDIDKLNRLDKIPFEEIEKIVSFGRNDSFWSKNFLSILKLRRSNQEGVKYLVVLSEAMKASKNNNGKMTKDEEQQLNREILSELMEGKK